MREIVLLNYDRIIIKRVLIFKFISNIRYLLIFSHFTNNKILNLMLNNIHCQNKKSTHLEN